MMDDLTPTRGAALALVEERTFLQTGYEFLDEKRMLLAATLLEELAQWREARRAYDLSMAAAITALKSAVMRHGLEGIALYPAPEGSGQGFNPRERNFLGISLLVDPDQAPEWTPPPETPAVDASARAEACRPAFAALVPLASTLAIRARNIDRLIREYRATERRARALENVILPETQARLAAITDYLDELDQEEAVHIRHAGMVDRRGA